MLLKGHSLLGDRGRLFMGTGMWEDFKTWSGRFWWGRGIVATPPIIFVLDDFTGFTELQILTFFHAIVIKWDFWTQLVAGFLTLYIPILNVDAALVNTLIVWGCFGPSSAFLETKAWNAYRRVASIDRSKLPENYGRRKTDIKELADDGLFRWAEKKKKSLPWQALGYSVSFFIALYFLFSDLDFSPFDGEGFPQIVVYLLLFVCAFLTLSMIYSVLKELPPLRKGLIHSLAVLATCQVLYFVNLPVVVDWVNNTTCASLEESATPCEGAEDSAE